MYIAANGDIIQFISTLQCDFELNCQYFSMAVSQQMVLEPTMSYETTLGKRRTDSCQQLKSRTSFIRVYLLIHTAKFSNICFTAFI